MGTYCPRGSAELKPCDNSTVYCPARSAAPRAVRTGHKAQVIAATNLSIPIAGLAPSAMLSVAQTACTDRRYFCADGVAAATANVPYLSSCAEVCTEVEKGYNPLQVREWSMMADVRMVAEPSPVLRQWTQRHSAQLMQTKVQKDAVFAKY